jgi:hypothetical protein
MTMASQHGSHDHARHGSKATRHRLMKSQEAYNVFFFVT